MVPSALKVAVPVSVSPLGVVRIAVNTTPSPWFEGFGEDVTEMDGSAPEASKAPIAGGLGRSVPSRSAAGRIGSVAVPAVLPAPFAGDDGRMRRLVPE